MKVIGLTGSIGMGKSTAAGLLRRLGVPVHDGDAAVHRLLAPGGKAVAAVAAAFPDAMSAGKVDRARLGAAVFADPKQLRRLEALLHPLVRAERGSFLKRMRAARRKLVVLDIPLLFETGAETSCDAVIVMTAPAFLQEQRLRRRNLAPARLAEIRRRQMPDAEKRRRADFVIASGAGRRPVLAALRRIVRGAGGAGA